MYVNASQGEGDMEGPWNSGPQWDRVDDLSRVLPADASGDGSASVKLGGSDLAAVERMMTRLESDPASDPVTGADLGAGPGAGRTSKGDKGGADSMTSAVAMGEAAEAKELAR
jgi:Mn-containing catalase